MTTDVHSQSGDARRRKHAEFRGRCLAPAASDGSFGLFGPRYFRARARLQRRRRLREAALRGARPSPNSIEGGGPFAITISIDPDAKTLTFADNGVGMSREELVEALGTIASSGTRAFLEKLGADDKAKEGAANLIGQFGIGFYSAFMVADRVVVESRRAGDTRPGAGRPTARAPIRSRRCAIDDAPHARRARHPAPQRSLAANTPTLIASSRSCASIPARSPCRSTSSTSRAPSRAASPTARRSGPRRNPTSRRSNIPNSIAASPASSTSPR